MDRSNDDNIQHSHWLVQHPDVFKNLTMNIGRLLKRADSNTSFVEKCAKLRSFNPKGKRWVSVDFEALYAIENFFWGMTGGLSVELGALDGNANNYIAASQTGDFVDLGWHRIIIEANPTYRDDMKKFSPDALAVNSAICNAHKHDKEHRVHYIYRKGVNSPVAGIIEFMTPHFLKTFYPYLLVGDPPVLVKNFTDAVLPDGVKISRIACLPLQKVFDYVMITHVNFFVLDVEGGELDVLHSIDWHRTTFDVLCIETDKEHRAEGYAHHVTHYLGQRGYALVHEDRRNSWYVHQGLFDRLAFEPVKRPGCCPVPDDKNFPWPWPIVSFSGHS